MRARGRLSELTGPYSPIGRDRIETELLGIPSVIFPVKTARRKGRIRPIGLPVEGGYEPWAKILLDWFKVHDDAPPFGGLTGRSYQREAGLVFKGLMWPVEAYEKTVYEKINDTNIILEWVNSEGFREFLVEYPDLSRSWVDDPKLRLRTEKLDRHWINFSLQSLRHQRIRELKFFYRFSDEDIKIFTGLTRLDGVRANIGLERYDWVNPSDKLQIESLTYSVQTYFDKFLKYRD